MIKTTILLLCLFAKIGILRCETTTETTQMTSENVTKINETPAENQTLQVTRNEGNAHLVDVKRLENEIHVPNVNKSENNADNITLNVEGNLTLLNESSTSFNNELNVDEQLNENFTALPLTEREDNATPSNDPEIQTNLSRKDYPAVNKQLTEDISTAVLLPTLQDNINSNTNAKVTENSWKQYNPSLNKKENSLPVVLAAALSEDNTNTEFPIANTNTEFPIANTNTEFPIANTNAKIPENSWKPYHPSANKKENSLPVVLAAALTEDNNNTAFPTTARNPDKKYDIQYNETSSDDDSKLSTIYDSLDNETSNNVSFNQLKVSNLNDSQAKDHAFLNDDHATVLEDSKLLNDTLNDDLFNQLKVSDSNITVANDHELFKDDHATVLKNYSSEINDKENDNVKDVHHDVRHVGHENIEHSNISHVENNNSKSSVEENTEPSLNAQNVSSFDNSKANEDQKVTNENSTATNNSVSFSDVSDSNVDVQSVKETAQVSDVEPVIEITLSQLVAVAKTQAALDNQPIGGIAIPLPVVEDTNSENQFNIFSPLFEGVPAGPFSDSNPDESVHDEVKAFSSASNAEDTLHSRVIRRDAPSTNVHQAHHDHDTHHHQPLVSVNVNKANTNSEVPQVTLNSEETAVVPNSHETSHSRPLVSVNVNHQTVHEHDFQHPELPASFYAGNQTVLGSNKTVTVEKVRPPPIVAIKVKASDAGSKTSVNVGSLVDVDVQKGPAVNENGAKVSSVASPKQVVVNVSPDGFAALVDISARLLGLTRKYVNPFYYRHQLYPAFYKSGNKHYVSYSSVPSYYPRSTKSLPPYAEDHFQPNPVYPPYPFPYPY